MATPGLTKLNIPRKTAIKQVAARNVSTASRATGATSFGIFAQRSMAGSGGIFNVKTFNSDSIAAQRRILNSSRQSIERNYYGGHQCSGSDNNNGMNKFMAGMMAVNMLGQLTAQTVDTVKSLKGDGSVKDTGNVDKKGNNGIQGGGKLSKKLGSAKSFGEIESIEKQTDEKIQNFQTDYSKTGQDTINGINDLLNGDAKAGLELAGVSIDTSSLSLSNLSIDPDNLSTLDNATETINKDIEKATSFKTDTIKSGIDSLVSKSGELQQQIGRLESNKAKTEAAEVEAKNNGTAMPSPSSVELQKQIDEAKKQKEQVDTAKTTLEQKVTGSVDQLIKELGDKQKDIADIKNVKADLADKKYDMAKEQDEQLTSNMKKMDRLEKQINEYRQQALSSDAKKSENAKKKLGGAISQFNQFVDVMNRLKESISQAGDSSFTNSKGKTYTIKNTSIDEKYTTSISESSEEGSSQKTAGNIALDSSLSGWEGAIKQQPWKNGM